MAWLFWKELLKRWSVFLVSRLTFTDSTWLRDCRRPKTTGTCRLSGVKVFIGWTGGNSKSDIVFGFRDNETAYTGGVRILYLDLNALPPGAADPAGSTQDYMAPSIAIANLNYRINNTTAGPYYPDLAVALKTSATTGTLLVFIR